MPSGSDQGRIGRRQLLLGGLLLAARGAARGAAAPDASRFAEGGESGGEPPAALPNAIAQVSQHLLTLAGEIPVAGGELARALSEGPSSEGGAAPLAEQRDPEALAKELLAKPASLESLEAVRDALARRIHEDFLAGETQILAGWLLSRTEARFLALAVRVAAQGGPTTPAA